MDVNVHFISISLEQHRISVDASKLGIISAGTRVLVFFFLERSLVILFLAYFL